jgi:hypothetical protein
MGQPGKQGTAGDGAGNVADENGGSRDAHRRGILEGTDGVKWGSDRWISAGNGVLGAG